MPVKIYIAVALELLKNLFRSPDARLKAEQEKQARELKELDAIIRAERSQYYKRKVEN